MKLYTLITNNVTNEMMIQSLKAQSVSYTHLGSWQIFLETNAEFFKNESKTLFLAGITGMKEAKIQMYREKQPENRLK